MSKLKQKKAPAQGKNNAEMLKNVGKTGEETLWNLLNDILDNRTILFDWYIGIIMSWYKKEDMKISTNYRRKSLTNLPATVHTWIFDGIMRRMRKQIEHNLEELQHGVRKWRSSTQDLIFTLSELGKKFLRKNKEVHTCFIDFTKPHGSATRCMGQSQIEKSSYTNIRKQNENTNEERQNKNR